MPYITVNSGFSAKKILQKKNLIFQCFAQNLILAVFVHEAKIFMLEPLNISFPRNFFQNFFIDL